MANLTPITQRMHKAGIRRKEWCANNRASNRYLGAIERGERAAEYQFGEAKRIIEALKRDGFWVEPKKARRH